ncbi:MULTISPECIES: MFS transporter [Actinosynnema]|uniref:MFS transporter n=1 Tax=Actinosynnema TaxID=40566 RepID=UPI0020A4B6D6|nr:MFS transporter [Actinosynnema pretiosum]MCP2098787.1 Major Facilitator Superfamily protein [Actinosynnema pretiosum]
MSGIKSAVREMSPAARLLVVNQFGINLGFYAVLPFLATHLRDGLGFSAALVGVVLGVRTLSQQGLYLVGGTAADLLGPRAMIIAGCGLRVVGFGLLAFTASLPGVLLGVALTGVAGALFNPAVRTYLTHESAGRRAEAFAVFEAVANAGALIGPVLGAVLLAVDFSLVSLVACAVFAVLTAAQALVLPHRPATAAGTRVLGNWGRVLANRRFLVFTLAGSAYFALFNQLYLLLPLEAERITGWAGAVTGVFAVSTVVGIAFGVRLTRWCKRHWSAGRSMAVGLALTGAGFLPLALASPLLPDADGGLAITEAVGRGLPVLAGTAVFSAGIAITNPFMMELLPVVGEEELVGTYYGAFYLVSALVAAGLSAAVGALLDLGGATSRWAPPLLLAAVAGAAAALVAVMLRRGLLGERAATPAP